MTTATASKKTATPETEAFEISAENIQIGERSGMAPARFATIANVPGHGIIAREETRTSHGVMVKIFEWDQGLNVLGRELGQTFDGESVLINQLSRLSGLTQRYEGPGIEQEVFSFAQQFPRLAEALELGRFLRKPAFEIGYTTVQKAQERHPLASAICWHDLIRQHSEGSHGRYGSLDLNHEFSDEELFTLPLQPVHLQNLAAIRTQRGCIRSEFQVPGRSGLCYVLTVFMTNRAEGIRSIAWQNPV
jgi:hypothetical protein